MTGMLPEYLEVEPDQLGVGGSVTVHRVGDMAEIASVMADTMLDVLVQSRAERRAATLIVPVGPVDQFPVLAERINQRRLDCRDVMLINMDEYLTDDDHWIPEDHPLSFRGFMNRKFYDLVDPALAPRHENRVYPDPRNTGRIQELIVARGSVDMCLGGIGINGHIAFNEPPEPGESTSVEHFASLPTRNLTLSRETRTINSVTVGGEISLIPWRAVTVGMREILAARKLRFYCNRPWQRAVVRRVLHGPLTAACPASLLRLHADAELTIADFAAQRPEIRLR